MDRDLGKFSDEQLCSMAASGDDSAMAELISRITPLAAACINNRIISVLRSRNAQKNIPQDMMQNIDDGEEVQDFSADPQNIYSAQEDDARFEDLLSEKLTDFERSVLTLRAEKLSYEEIAERLGTNPKAVDNALQRIRRKLASDSRR